MPLIKYQCSDCQHTVSKMYKTGIGVPKDLGCEKCSGKAKRILSSPASSSKITIDNGVQARAVEIDPDIMEINSERARKPVDRGD